MEDLMYTLLGKGPYPFDVEHIENYTRYYESASLNIVITKVNISFTKGPQVHSHDSYEFLIPLTPMPHIGCDNERIFVPQHMVFPINALQEHGPLDNMSSCLFAAIHIEGEFMRQVAGNICGEPEISFANKPVPLSRELKILIKKFAEESEKSIIGNKLIIECLSTQIAIQLLRDCILSEAEMKFSEVGSDKVNLAGIVDSFYNNYANLSYSTETAAKEANLSKYYFIKVFKEYTGKTPYSFLLDLRINKAKELLKESAHSITEIYFLCGFVNHSHFATSFKKKVGMSPSMFRKVHHLG